MFFVEHDRARISQFFSTVFDIYGLPGLNVVVRNILSFCVSSVLIFGFRSSVLSTFSVLSIAFLIIFSG